MIKAYGKLKTLLIAIINNKGKHILEYQEITKIGSERTMERSLKFTKSDLYETIQRKYKTLHSLKLDFTNQDNYEIYIGCEQLENEIFTPEHLPFLNLLLHPRNGCDPSSMSRYF